MVNSIDIEINTVNEVCQTCFSKLLNISFQKKTAKEPMIGCCVCDDQIDELLETKMAKRFRYGARGRGGDLFLSR